MDYKNIFTTYNSVDPPVWITQEEQIPEPIIPENPLYQLLDKFQFKKDDVEQNSTPKEEKNIWNNYEVANNTEAPQNYGKISNSQKEFVQTMKPIYEKALQEKGLDTSYANYLVAQSALESNWGKSQSGQYNLGGIKLPSKQKGKGLGTIRKTREIINGKDVYITDEFRNFKDLEDYARFHIGLLNNMNYRVFNGDFINNVVRGGYATDPKYKDVLNRVYQQILRLT